MTLFRLAGVLLVLAGIVATGCNPPAGNTEGSTDSNATTSAAPATAPAADAAAETKPVAIYCGKCGEVKGSDTCCKDGEKCDKCAFHKGSALCCKHLPEDVAGKDICSGCGQTADAEHKCDPNAEKCEKCGLDKGSPACCKL